MDSITFYHQHYLSPSMTFIYRQLLGASQEFDVNVICTRLCENINIFPHDKIYCLPQSNYSIKISRLKEILLNKPSYNHRNIEPKLSTLKEFIFPILLVIVIVN